LPGCQKSAWNSLDWRAT